MKFHLPTFWEKLKQTNRPILALAPMAGITDAAFRQMCKAYGADLVYSEMVSVDGLEYASKKTLSRALFAESERPIIVQLMGSDPEKFAHAAKQLEAMGVDGIDINFGCPAKKITKNCSGAALMEDLDRAHEILAATIAATSLPVSCKIRKSKYSSKEGRDITGLEFVRRMADLPIAALMVHGRRYEQVHGGPVDYEYIAEIKKEFNGVVLANGGINTPEDAVHALAVSGADGLGIARGAVGHPYIFKQIRDMLETGTYTKMTTDDIRDIALAHVRLSYSHKEGRGLLEMRKHLGNYVRGMANASRMREKLMKVNTLEEVEEILKGME